ncbi:MAG: aldo/keto reductase [Tistrella sp.]|jgi:diketogulonate reductase-like aldo/keto reductase|uniref:Aldo/keto reductase n=1 Tax=Tistrella mobilis TaxID=171437 RepID=A0A3B9ILD0_9PROT|nr:aldo/keto reductase [Tistrella sp.]MAD35881.1 aldo/keto reductase [Tistrella sp.]MBA74545.1 aldo/keto reductase [Tistrella sp.]HAE48029.1 aldo/keto reductase [Tistrella mobilis]|tara:strand:- start:107 stop:1069 length:963 start_codon:yes stop_codon:yes gene_type:complete
MTDKPISRRQFLCSTAAGLAAFTLSPGPAGAAGSLSGVSVPGAGTPLLRAIPSTGRAVPAVGLGTWITFNVGRDAQAIAGCTEVMRAFFDAGGRVIDSSPMYGSSQMVVGQGLATLDARDRVFSAEKVWTSSGRDGPGQIEETRRFWGVKRFSLMQVHNLLAWQDHLETLFAMKAEGRLDHVGITTSEGRRHDGFEQVMATQPLDSVQVTYNPLDREVEARILPLAADHGQAVIVNRPFRQGALTRRLAGVPLPGWSRELEVSSWAQALLKFILAHPAVTCVIPATTRVDHVRENLAAASGPLPDRALRERIAADVEAAV